MNHYDLQGDRCFGSNSNNGYKSYGSSNGCSDWTGRNSGSSKAIDVYEFLPSIEYYFYDSEGTKTWAEAKDYCEKIGGPRSAFIFFQDGARTTGKLYNYFPS